MATDGDGSEAASRDAVRGRASRAERIAVLTAGGDAPGMNAAVRSVVRVAQATGLAALGVERGFEGLLFGNFTELSSRSVANIIQRGGTVLETSRCDRFRAPDGRRQAAENLRYRGVDALVVIGGDGTLAAARALASETGTQVMFIPASIDNDISGTDYSIGFDTAVNTALDAIDRIRDTAFAYERLFFVEVMGRDSGFIALAVAIAGGAEAVIVPEVKADIDALCRRIEESQLRGKRSSIVVVSEGPRTGGAMAIASAVSERVGGRARVVVLGHIQRGGSPTARDRLLASRMGAAAVRGIIEGRPPSLIGERCGEVVYVPLAQVPEGPPPLDPELVELVFTLSV